MSVSQSETEKTNPKGPILRDGAAKSLLKYRKTQDCKTVLDKKAKINSPLSFESAARTSRADFCTLKQLIKFRLIVLPRGEVGLRKPLQNCKIVMRERSKDTQGKSTPKCF